MQALHDLEKQVFWRKEKILWNFNASILWNFYFDLTDGVKINHSNHLKIQKFPSK